MFNKMGDLKVNKHNKQFYEIVRRDRFGTVFILGEVNGEGRLHDVIVKDLDENYSDLNKNSTAAKLLFKTNER